MSRWGLGIEIDGHEYGLILRAQLYIEVSQIYALWVIRELSETETMHKRIHLSSFISVVMLISLLVYIGRSQTTRTLCLIIQ